MKKKLLPLAAALLLCLAGCSTIRQVTPLEQGEHRFGIGVGGPLFTDVGFAMPVPMISVDYAYGITDSLTAGAALHVTPTLFKLPEGMGELFATYGILKQAGLIPSVVVGLDTILLSDFTTSFFALPELNAVASWKVTDFLALYGGAAVMLNFYPKTAGLPTDGAVAPGVSIGLLPSFPFGAQLLLGSFQITAETRLVRPFTSNRDIILHYIGLGDYGAIGVYLSVSYTLGGPR